MSEKDQAFDRVGEQFLDYYETVRGYVRQEVTRLNLWPYLGDSPLRVADIGGGDGRDAFWLANQHHDVVLADPSSEMLSKASSQQITELAVSHVQLVQGDAQTLLDRGEKGAFDLVLSHGVLMYDLHDYEGHIDRLSLLTKSNGYISLLTKGYGGAVERIKNYGNDAELDHLEQTHQVVNNLGETVWAFDENDLSAMLFQVGTKIVKWAGVRIKTDNDHRHIMDVDPKDLSNIIALEHQLGNAPSERSKGQMLHFIAQKI